MFQSPFANITWPQFHMPQVTFPKPQMPRLWPKRKQVDAARNAWVEKSQDPARPSPLQAVADGARRVGDSTRAAWHKTVDSLTPGEPARTVDNPQLASRDSQPPLWKRMFGINQPEPEGPRTVTEWMAQERLDP
jgi:hypothetical protein